MSACIIICCPDDRFLKRRYLRCPVCMCITETVIRFEAWYDATYYCCKCGDAWAGAELLERPFRRNWRAAAVRRARRLWDQATYGPPPTLEELLR